MSDLIAQGKVLYWGTSEWSAQEIMQAFAVATAIQPRPSDDGATAIQSPCTRTRRKRVRPSLFGNRHRNDDLVAFGKRFADGKYNDGIPKETRLGFEGNEWLREYVISK